jgi:hypothetical protein
MMEWRKSSRSTNTNSCVEVAGSLDAVRDSKNPDGPVLKFAPDGLGLFLAALHQGEFHN